MNKKRILAILLLIVLVLGTIPVFADDGSTANSENKATDEKKGDYLHLAGFAYFDYAFEVVNLVNKERQKAGLSALKMDQELFGAAMCRAAECNIVFSHWRTNGESPFTISPKAFAENIAWGQSTPAMVVSGWMGSPGHRSNIMNPSFKTIGVGCFTTGGSLSWVQLFGNGSNYIAAKRPSPGTQPIGLRVALPSGTNQYKDGYFNNTVTLTFGLTEKNLKLAVGETSEQAILTGSASQLFVPETTRWTSQDEKVATVNEGKVTAVGPGKTKVLAGSSLTLDRASLTVTAYERERIHGQNRYKTSIEAAKKLKRQLGVSKFETVIIASGTSFADALSGTYLAAEKKAPIILIDGNSTSTITEVVNYIKSNTTPGGTIYILGGPGAVAKRVDSRFGGYKVKRLAGKTRYETNIEILKEAGVQGKRVLVCTGANYADSLSASSSGLPILLVGNDLQAKQQSYLANAGAKNFLVVGGTGAVSAKVANQVRVYGPVGRVQGKTRYATSTALAERLFPNELDRMILVLGTNFPDGLSGGPIGVEYGVPVVLVSEKDYAAAKAFATMKNIRRVTILGGTGVVSNKVAAEVAAW